MASTKTLSCTADVSISELYSGNVYNSSDRLAFGVGSGSTDEYYALLKFGSLGLDTGAYNITSAKLTVTKISGALGYNATFNAVAQRITSSWSESTTWSTKPSSTSTGQSAAVAMGEGHSGSVTFDVTNIVQAWADGSSNYGILLKQNGTTASRIKCIGDRTSSSAAKLVITYEPKGVIYIANGSKFEAYEVYIANGSGWDKYVPYIANGSKFDICG